ncbi:RES family NAD+ phosphorylase [Ahrensia sp. R2A130]|uniref:RES family NAD+ phosphorylase n=1 Tax=Ahrensia sp. R2A130 TaxID=744979 RepID=UPI0001E0845C|nr:RES family NAD+ phosphorylase [Ahrensia sp. R2A130]EFL87457.1 putative toxin-antitoxin system, toxin component [Ahrensia sp. R2A130]
MTDRSALPASAYRGLLYRALNPRYAREPLSGEGAAKFGGRFNAMATPALYTSLAPDTAIREANQVGTLQPTVLVAYRANIVHVFDATDPASLAALNADAATLADPAWREKMLRNPPAPTQALATRLIDEGFDAMRIPSYAPGAGGAPNLVVWKWNETVLKVVDDEDRLTRF